jgi:hypothetical protein
MKDWKRTLTLLEGVALVAAWLIIGNSPAYASTVPSEETIATVSVGMGGVSFYPKVSLYQAITLSVSQPDGTVYQSTFESGATPVYKLPGNMPDGSYTYELRVVPQAGRKVREETAGEEKPVSGLGKPGWSEQNLLVQTGYFQVLGGRIITGGGTEPEPPKDLDSPLDIVHNDDVIITGSLAVGFDSVNGEDFGFDTIKLKENNLRILFDDTSSVAGYSANDWRLTANDSTSGGASYFAIEDATTARTLFTLRAGAPANSLYVDSSGRLGLKTSTPVLEFHIKDGDTPSIRLEQDSSYGWTAQTWDIAGNESNFFIRDATHGSKLPFRIYPNAPSDTLTLGASGKVGIGTHNPAGNLELEGTGSNIIFLIDRTDGATVYFAAKAGMVNFGSYTFHPVKFVVGGGVVMSLNTDGSLVMSSGATCTAGGTWQNASSSELKENIQTLTPEEATEAVLNLQPVKYTSKADRDERHVGFIAEQVPELVATKDRKGMSPMDIAAVLTKVVQDQQKTISELEERIAALEKKSGPEK